MRFVAGQGAVAKTLAEPMRTGRAAAAERLQRGCAGADCPDSYGKDASGAAADGIGHHGRDIAGQGRCAGALVPLCWRR